MGIGKEQLPGELVWRSEAERHLTLVAAAHLARSLDLPKADVASPELLSILRDMRNVQEHWDEYLPGFLSSPRGILKRSGKRFAEHFPDSVPWSSFAWNSKDGPMLLAGKISAAELHEALDQIETAVLQAWPSLTEFVPEQVPSPWTDTPGEGWWPKPEEPPEADPRTRQH
jgi:hypothetical protein